MRVAAQHIPHPASVLSPRRRHRRRGLPGGAARAAAGRVLHAACSAGGLVLVLVGLPTALLTVQGPVWAAFDVAAAVAQPLTPPVLVLAIIVVGWLLWGWLVAATALEFAAVLSRRRPPPRLLPGPLRTTVATMAGSVLLAFASGTANAASPPPSAGTVHTAGPPVGVLTPPADVVTAIPQFTAITTVGAAPAVRAVTVAGQHTTVTVQRGDTLWSIAGQRLGDPHRWPEIYQLNADRYDRHGRMHGGDHIEPPWVLVLPDDAAQPPAPTPATQPAVPPATTVPPTTIPPAAVPSTTVPTPSQSAVASPAVSPSATAPAVVVPGAAASETVTKAPTPSRSSQVTTIASPPAHSPAPSDTHADGSDQAPAEDHTFVEVLGGSISMALAAALLFTVAMVWRRRRQHYRPTPIDHASPDDPDLAPPMARLRHLRQTVRRHRPELLDTPAAGPTVREYTTADIKPALPQTGPTGSELAGVMHLPISTGVGLDGPGALDAARGLLVASLTAGSPDDPDAQGQVVIPGSTLATLLGISAVDLPPMRRLTVTANTGDAITEVEEAIIRRTRIVTDHDADDLAALREAHPLAEPLPQLLLLCDVPEPRHQQRLATAIHLGEKVDIGAALIGDWPHGPTLTVAADGTTTGDDATSRVTVLDTDAATAVLSMLAEANADSPASTVPESRPQPPTTVRPPVAEASSPPDAPPGRVPAQRPAPTPPQHADSGPVERVQVRVLGDPAILGQDGQPMRGLRGKALELLVYLAVHRDGAALSEIMEALWPEATWRRASERLSTCVGNLRGVLRAAHPSADTEDADDADTTDTPDDKARGDKTKAAVRKPDPIPNTGSRYHLDPAFVQVDWWTVLDEYTQVATAGDDEARLHHLAAAVTVVSGPLANGHDYDWVDTDREHVRRRLIKLHAHAADLLRDDDPHQARMLYDSACLLDPLSDELARRAMQTAAAAGDTDGIRHRLKALRQALQDNGLDIDDSTEQLAADLLRELTPNPEDQ